MYLEKFMNKHKDWKERLSVAPYFIEIKQDGEYYILKYNMIQSDFSRPEVLEARGSIFRCVHNEWRCVCRAMDKFGNWQESYAATNKIDWSREISIQEKIDGSLMKCWYDEGEWHISTNGTIDAFKADCGDTTYGDLFMSLVQQHSDWDKFLDTLSTDYTYWFELVHPQYNQIVVRYTEPALYFLGMRHNQTHIESINYKSNPIVKLNPWLKQPRYFIYHSLDECLEAAHKMGENEEGYVVCAYTQMENDSFLRIKIKGDEYLKRHRLRGNGPLTTAKIISLWQQDILDDFLAYFPENVTLVNNTIEKLCDLWEKADIAYEIVRHNNKRKDFAINAAKYIKPIQSYLFARLDNKVDCAQTYFKQMKPRDLASLIDIKEIS